MDVNLSRVSRNGLIGLLVLLFCLQVAHLVLNEDMRVYPLGKLQEIHQLGQLPAELHSIVINELPANKGNRLIVGGVDGVCAILAFKQDVNASAFRAFAYSRSATAGWQLSHDWVLHTAPGGLPQLVSMLNGLTCSH